MNGARLSPIQQKPTPAIGPPFKHFALALRRDTAAERISKSAIFCLAITGCRKRGYWKEANLLQMNGAANERLR
jgi:hypothetical protein